MDIMWESGNEITIGRVDGRLDISRSKEFQDLIMARLDEAPESLLLELSRLNYLSSSGVGVFLTVNKRLQTLKKRFGICSVPAPVRKVLELVDVIQHLPIYPDEATALADMQKD